MPTSANAVRLLARPDEWAIALELKVDGRNFNLAGREYIIPVIRDTSQKMVVKKAAQTAFTITFLVRTFHWITEKHWHHLYLLPLKTGAIPFVQKRVDPIIDSNPLLEHKFKSVDNRTHKQTQEDISLLIRGTNVESELQETPTDVVVFDEFDRMVQDYLEDAKHRTDGSLVKRLTYLSTPTVPGHGLDSEDEWWDSDMHKWYVKCPGCNRFQTFLFEENVRIGDNKYECRIECSHCSRPFSDVERAEANKTGKWEPSNLQGNFRGYHINQFNSPTMPLESIMEGYFLGQRDAKKMKAFYNQSLGEPYSSPGNQVTPEILDSCIDPAYQMGGIPNGPVFIGIDVGHDEIYVKADHLGNQGQRMVYGMWHFKDRPGKTAWEALEEKVLSVLTNWVCVCDAHPDKRGARALSVKYSGKFFMGLEKDRPEQEEIAKFDRPTWKEPAKVIIDRTLAFDSTIHQMMTGMYVLPSHARSLGEEMPRRDYNAFYSHMMQMVRVEEEDASGRIRASWQKNKNADHWHHADMFAFVATMRKPSLVINSTISGAFQRAGSVVAA